MTILKIYRLEDPDETEALSILTEGEHVIGRGNLNCNDKRVSRRHALISIGKDDIMLKSVHVNPCFYKSSGANNISILTKDKSITLTDHDQFALLADSFWFKVRVLKDSNEHGSNKRTNQEIENELSPSKRQKVSNETTLANEPEVSSSDANTTCDNLVNITTDNIGNNTSNGSLNMTVSSENNQEDIADDEEPNVNVSHGVEENQQVNCGNKDEESVVEIKQEDISMEGQESEDVCPITDDVAVEPSSSTGPVEGGNASTDSVKKEQTDGVTEGDDNAHSKKIEDTTNANQRADTDTKPKPRRERCWYGQTCYRKNPQHRLNFTHPGDNDYDSDPNDDRMDCPFGITCYRTNLQHRREFKHQGRPAPKPRKLNVNFSVQTGCPLCPHCSNQNVYRKPGYESDFDGDSDSGLY